MNTITINLPQKSYPIYIKKGLLDLVGREIKKIYKGKKIVVITDKNIDKFYGQIIEDNLNNSDFEVRKIILEPGEKSKSIQCLLEVYEKLLEFGMTRSDLIITFGGGVVGDLGGFAASTFLRGIPFIQIPTSLLAQVDSSVGGKVAVDLPQGKNLVGSFYHPKAVFIDPDVLKTLDKRFLYDGMAEVIKYGCIRDKELFYKLLKFNSEEDLFNNIEDVIHTCCSIKKDVVEKDEKDKGERMILNFGHTIGHAIEKYFGFEKYTHGEAVAVGMYAITKKSEALGITKDGTSDLIKKIIIKYNLSFEMPEVDMEKTIDIIGFDKKNKGNNLNIILLEEIGKCFIKEIENKQITQYI